MTAVSKNGVKSFFKHSSLKTMLIYIVLIGIINSVVFLALNQLDFIHYETNDDFVLQSLLSGSLGEQYVQFPHMNFALQKFIVILYQAVPSLNCYGIFLFGMLLLSATLVGAILLDKFGIKTGLLIYLLTVPIYYGLFLGQFQYTIVAYSLLIASFAGFIYGFYVPRKNTRIFLYILSAVFLILSICMRNETVVSAAVYFAALLIFIWIRHGKKAGLLLATVLASFAVVGAFMAADNAYYNSTEELQSFKAFHEARIEMVDRAPLNYETHKEAFEQAGWTQTDTNLFSEYVYPDDEKFSVQNLNNIITARKDVSFMTDPAAIVASVISTFNDSNVYMLCLLFVALIFAYLSGKRRLFAVFLFLLPFAVQILLLMLWRPVNRAVYPHYVMSIIALIMITDLGALKQRLFPGKFTKEEAKPLWRTAILVLAAVVLVLNANMFLNAKWDGESKALDPKARDARLALEYFSKNPEETYLYSTDSDLITVNESYSIFSAFPQGYLANSRVLGGWNTRSPSYNDFKEKNGLETLPLDMIDNDHVYYVAGETIGLMTGYFYETYGIPVKYERVAQIGENLFVYRIRSTTIDEIDTIY